MCVSAELTRKARRCLRNSACHSPREEHRCVLVEANNMMRGGDLNLRGIKGLDQAVAGPEFHSVLVERSGETSRLGAKNKRRCFSTQTGSDRDDLRNADWQTEFRGLRTKNRGLGLERDAFVIRAR